MFCSKQLVFTNKTPTSNKTVFHSQLTKPEETGHHLLSCPEGYKIFKNRYAVSYRHHEEKHGEINILGNSPTWPYPGMKSWDMIESSWRLLFFLTSPATLVFFKPLIDCFPIIVCAPLLMSSGDLENESNNYPFSPPKFQMP